jgi:cation:H+ antiporter
MKQKIVYIGLDVDDTQYHGSALDKESGELLSFRCRPTLKGLLGQLAKIRKHFPGHTLKLAYEASYIGFTLQRDLAEQGICCDVVAPSSIPRKGGKAVKTDRILFLVLVLAGDSALGRVDASIFLVSLAAYLVWAYRSELFHAAPSGELHQAEAEELSAAPKSALWTVIAVVIGLLLLIGGSQVLLLGAIGIAEHFDVPEAVIGLTLVAVGTSLPELSISVVAAIRRHADVAVGNVLGSNIFNLLGILGVSSLLQPLPVHARILHFDQWVMLGASLLLFLFLYTGRRLSRFEGGILLVGYGLYVWLSFTAFNG